MEPAATMSASPAFRAEPESAEVRARQLAAARRRATALLGAVTVLFVAVTVAGAHGTLLGYVQAGAEASMVGGVADWFAVTALFRHPLGLPIPHTALIVERKDQFAATLGQFFQQNFLNADVLVDRIESARLAPRLATWMAEPAHAARLADYAAHLVSQVAVLLSDEDVHDLLTEQLTLAVERLDLPALFAGGVRAATAADGGSEIFEATVRAVDRYLAAHKEELGALFASQSPAWVPHVVSRRLFDHLHGRIRHKLVDMTTNPDDESRQRFQQWIADLPEHIRSSPEVRHRA